MKTKRKSSDRNGVTAVEFAMVAPVVFLLVFFIFEVARLMMFGGNVNTALLTGVRQATIADSTATEIDESIREELKRFGINEVDNNIFPPNFTPSDTSVRIDVDVPIGTSVGFELSHYSRSITVDRESQ